MMGGPDAVFVAPRRPFTPPLLRGNGMPPDHITAPVVYKEIHGHPGYRVGSDGSIWSRIRRGARRGGTFSVTWTRIKGCAGNRGHLTVRLTPSVYHYVHRLVLEAFVGPCPPGMECCHDPDPDPANNRLENLRWDTKKGNSADMDRLGRRYLPNCNGERHVKTKLSESDVLEIRRLSALKVSRSVIAEQFGIRARYVTYIARRKAWAHLPAAREERA